MFKYLRTLNSDRHPTEIHSVISHASEDEIGTVKAGTIVSVAYGEIFECRSDTPLYLALNSKSKNEEKYINCIKLSSDMVLEADVDSNVSTSDLVIGALCTILSDASGKGATVTVSEGYGAFQIIGNENAKNGKVTVVVI